MYVRLINLSFILKNDTILKLNQVTFWGWISTSAHFINTGRGKTMTNNTLGKYLKGLRKKKGYDQEYVSSILGISRQAYSHYETGRATPPVDICYKLAEILSSSPDDIISLTAGNFNSSAPTSASVEEVQSFLEFLEDKKNANKVRYLNTREREMVFYFDLLSPSEQTEIIEIIKLKLKLGKK